MLKAGRAVAQLSGSDRGAGSGLKKCLPAARCNEHTMDDEILHIQVHSTNSDSFISSNSPKQVCYLNKSSNTKSMFQSRLFHVFTIIQIYLFHGQLL